MQIAFLLTVILELKDMHLLFAEKKLASEYFKNVSKLKTVVKSSKRKVAQKFHDNAT